MAGGQRGRPVGSAGACANRRAAGHIGSLGLGHGIAGGDRDNGRSCAGSILGSGRDYDWSSSCTGALAVAPGVTSDERLR